MASQTKTKKQDSVGGDIYVVRFSSKDDAQTKAWRAFCARMRQRKLERDVNGK